MPDIYHVTFSKNVRKILLEGVIPFQTTNWVRTGDKTRYGTGEIYAFAELEDAVRWAGKMDWQFHQEIGSGKISIIRFNRRAGWKRDDADPMGQFGRKGDWLKRMQWVRPDDITGVAPVTIAMTRALVDGSEMPDTFLPT